MNLALVTEGTTDRPIIEASILSLFNKKFREASPFINTLQPKNQEPGGWTRVLTYCGSEEFKNSFDFNKYMIIQIDSDKHTDPGYDVPDYDNDTDLILAIQTRIIQSIGIDFYNTVSDRIIFAISIESIECWLLAFYATTKAHKAKKTNCCITLNTYLVRKGFSIDCNKSQGSYEYFVKASEPLTKKKIFFANYKLNESLKYFVEKELSKIKE